MESSHLMSGRLELNLTDMPLELPQHPLRESRTLISFHHNAAHTSLQWFNASLDRRYQPNNRLNLNDQPLN